MSSLAGDGPEADFSGTVGLVSFIHGIHKELVAK